jgi:hypothetical protein
MQKMFSGASLILGMQTDRKQANRKLKGKSTLKLIISEIAAIGTTIVPLALWFFEDYPVEPVVVLYAIESVLAMVFAALCVFILAPSHDSSVADITKYKRRTLTEFALIGGISTLIILTFPATFIFLHGQRKGVLFEDVKFGFTIVFGFQLFEFFFNLYLLRPLSLKQSETFLSYSFGGMALILISMFFGVFLATFFNIKPFLPFIILKTIIDIGQPIQYFLGQIPSQTESLFDNVTVKTQVKY